MTAWPRAIVGPVMGMARPSRPALENAAVREAAEIIRAETGLTSAKAVAREIAQRVVALMLADLEQDDPLALALAALEQQFAKSPFRTLATCPEIDTAADFVERRVNRLRARSGRYLTPGERTTEREAIASDLRSHLAGRYDRHLRG